jgi:hypothetical protein
MQASSSFNIRKSILTTKFAWWAQAATDYKRP